MNSIRDNKKATIEAYFNAIIEQNKTFSSDVSVIEAAGKFRKALLEDGFDMFQFSIYIRCCPSMENLNVHKKRVISILPEYGKVNLLHLTDKQFGMMEVYYGQKRKGPPKGPQQLTFF